MERLAFLLINGIAKGAVYAAVALALVLIWRSTRVLNFAQGAMAVSCVYVAYSVQQATGSVWVGMGAAVLFGAVMGLLVERLIIRFVDPDEPLAGIIVMLGLMTLIQGVLGAIYGAQFLSFPAPFSKRSLSIGEFPIVSPQDLFATIAVALAMGALGWLFVKTNLGLRLRASALGPATARLLGVKVNRMLTLGWILATAMAAVGGLLVVPSGLGLQPTAMDAALILGFTAAVIGGLDSPAGAVIGGVGMGIVLSFSSSWLGSAAVPIVSLILLVGVLLIRPGGIFTLAGARKV